MSIGEPAGCQAVALTCSAYRPAGVLVRLNVGFVMRKLDVGNAKPSPGCNMCVCGGAWHSEKPVSHMPATHKRTRTRGTAG